MRASAVLAGVAALSSLVLAAPTVDVGQVPLQLPLSSAPTLKRPPSHLSEWTRTVKADFLAALQAGNASEYVVVSSCTDLGCHCTATRPSCGASCQTTSSFTPVMGNEGGDLDSLASSIAFAYHLAHKSPAMLAVPLLQVKRNRIELRPENRVALVTARMEGNHEDLLTMDELPFEPAEVAKRIRGIALVDHNAALAWWGPNVRVVAVIDHHVDRELYPSAHPRIIGTSASCASFVGATIVGHSHRHADGRLPRELIGLLLSAIAIDSDGLKERKSFDVDRATARDLLPRSFYADWDLDDLMEELDDELGAAKKDLGSLSVRDLLRRDWKGDVIETPSPTTPPVHLGFASVPISIVAQSYRTDQRSIADWFEEVVDWSRYESNDVAVVVTSFKTRAPSSLKGAKRVKRREIALSVRPGTRLNSTQADDIFEVASAAIDRELQVAPWSGPIADVPEGRFRIWSNLDDAAGRKVVRPVVEKAVTEWEMR